jgi:hypothetical protein
MNRVAARAIAVAVVTELRTTVGPVTAAGQMAPLCHATRGNVVRMVRQWDQDHVAPVPPRVAAQQVVNCRNFTSRSKSFAVRWRRCAAIFAGTMTVGDPTVRRNLIGNRVAAARVIDRKTVRRSDLRIPICLAVN